MQIEKPDTTCKEVPLKKDGWANSDSPVKDNPIERSQKRTLAKFRWQKDDPTKQETGEHLQII
jgi:hypothetical protein